jgi:hypothetical protein
MRFLANGDIQKEAELWNYVCQAYKNGHGIPLLIGKVSGQLLTPKDPQLWQYLRALADRLFLRKEDMPEFARCCRQPPPSCCSDTTKAASLPSRPAGQLPWATPAMIDEELRSEYNRAEAAGEKPPNVKEVLGPVQLALRHKGYRATRSQIEKRAEAEEFKSRRWPPGKRRR